MTTLRSFLGRAVHNLAERAGYVLTKQAVMPYGVSAFWDIHRLCKAWDRPVQVIFDVGANSGQTAAMALKRFPQAHIFCFEPHPETYQRLRGTIQDSRAETFQIALSDRQGTVPFFEYGEKGGNSLINSISPNHKYPSRMGYAPREIEVATTTLDHFCREKSVYSIDILKIDTEGHEKSVLMGSEKMLSQGNIKFVYLEFHELGSSEKENSTSLCAIATLLSRFGFHFIAAYTDYIMPDAPLFVSSNALFAREAQEAS